MGNADENGIIQQHLQLFFAGHACKVRQWSIGPAAQAFPRLRVLELAPGPKFGLWVYTSVGAWEIRDEPRHEFLLVAPKRDQRHVELVTMVAWYHRRYRLGDGHTLPLGGLWMPRSSCDHILLSQPYPFGPDLEICNLPEWQLQVLWLLPITAAERDFKVREGLEALEQLFDDAGMKYWDPGRASVV